MLAWVQSSILVFVLSIYFLSIFLVLNIPIIKINKKIRHQKYRLSVIDIKSIGCLLLSSIDIDIFDQGTEK